MAYAKETRVCSVKRQKAETQTLRKCKWAEGLWLKVEDRTTAWEESETEEEEKLKDVWEKRDVRDGVGVCEGVKQS